MVNGREKDRNPWLCIPARDYEGHMGPDGVDQLAVLDRVLEGIYKKLKPARMLILGCGTGNGFRHVDPDVTARLVGVDINSAYIELARERYSALRHILELCCYYAEKCTFDLASFDLVHTALLLEYIDPEPLVQKIASWLAPGGTASFVLQEPSTREERVSQTGFESLKSLESIMRLLSPEVLRRIAARHNLREADEQTIPLKRDKMFCVAQYVKEIR